MPSRCKSCGQVIEFLETPLGKKMVVSVETLEKRVYIAGGRAVVGDTWISHMVDCPEAEKWRKKK
jgi:hypothetical protein